MEELNQAKRKAVFRRTRKQIVKLLKEYDGTEGVSVIDFCKTHKINKSNFYSWQKRFAAKGSVQGKTKGFIALQPSMPLVNPQQLFAEVGGIRLYQVVAPDYLKALLS